MRKDTSWTKSKSTHTLSFSPFRISFLLTPPTSTCFLQSASLHEARVWLLGSISSLQVGDRRGTDASAGEQAAEGLQAILHVGPVDVTAVGCATGVHHLEGGPQHLQQIPKWKILQK